MLNVLRIKQLPAHLWRVLKSSANCVHHCLCLELASVHDFIDIDCGEHIGSISLVILQVFINQSIGCRFQSPLGLIHGAEALVHTPLRGLPLQSFHFFVSKSGAVDIQVCMAFFVDRVDILPEQASVFLFLVSVFINAHLPQVLSYDIATCQVGRRWLLGAVFASTVAMFFLKLIIAVRTGPKHKARSHLDFVSEMRIDFAETLKEIKGQVVAAWVKDVILHSVVGASDIELRQNLHLFKFFGRANFKEINEFFSILFGNEHGWDSYASPSVVVWHHGVSNDVCFIIVHNNSNCSWGFLNVPHFFGKGALASVSDDEGGNELSFFLLFVIIIVHL